MAMSSSEGKLYICPTPIGNLKDITLRVIEVLKEVDLIACEDTRESGKLLSHYNIHTSLTSYHDHNRTGKGKKLVELLLSGKSIALISDAGMPGISDPGEDIIRECIEYGIEYTVLPGASAGIAALISSGLPAGRFVFEGFIPKIGKERKSRLSELTAERRTVIIYESPHNLLKTLVDLKEALGLRKLTVIRELSKKFEEKIYTDTYGAIELFKDKPPRGEFVLVVSGISDEELQEKKAEKYADVPMEEHLKMYVDRGIKKNEAMKMVAGDLGISKREVYSRLLKD